MRRCNSLGLDLCENRPRNRCDGRASGKNPCHARHDAGADRFPFARMDRAVVSVGANLCLFDQAVHHFRHARYVSVL
jgi:hypothetical protein